MGISALRLSMPYHDIRRPEELERSDYSVSANIGRTIAACRQAVVDIRCCLDWLEEQGYEHFGVLGTSLGSCYTFLASTHDARIRVNAFNHTQDRVRALWSAVSPISYYPKFASAAAGGPEKKVLLVYADYDLTFPKEYSLQVVEAFRKYGLDFEPRVLPCGHYTTGETPYKFIDGWYLGWFVYRAYKALRAEKAGSPAKAILAPVATSSPSEAEEEVISR
jgi:dienelactone hydrolase